MSLLKTFVKVTVVATVSAVTTAVVYHAVAAALDENSANAAKETIREATDSVNEFIGN